MSYIGGTETLPIDLDVEKDLGQAADLGFVVATVAAVLTVNTGSHEIPLLANQIFYFRVLERWIIKRIQITGVGTVNYFFKTLSAGVKEDGLSS